MSTEDIFLTYKICEHCGWPIEEKHVCKSLKWQGGPDPGDFVSTTLGTFVKTRVGLELASEFPPLNIGKVDVVNRPKDAADRRKGLYRGEEIAELRPTLRIQQDSKRCTLAPEKRFTPCPVCGRTVGCLSGIEMRPVRTFAPSRGRPPNYLRRVPRTPGKGVFLYEDELKDHDLFLLGGSLHIHCTERVASFIKAKNYSHVDLLEVGETVKRGEPIPIIFDELVPRETAKLEGRPSSVEKLGRSTGMTANPENLSRDPEGLRQFSFEISRLDPDTPETCPVPIADIEAYVEMESAGSHHTALRWRRTAAFNGRKYWVWDMDGGGNLTYVYVEDLGGTLTSGMNPARGLTIEQFLVHEFLRS